MVTVDYFTKYMEAEPLATITADKVIRFIYHTIFYHCRVPAKIVSNNETQFDNAKFRRLFDDHKVQKRFSMIARPQTNRQVEVVNKTLKQNSKTRLESNKGTWPEKLPEVLWAYHTTT